MSTPSPRRLPLPTRLHGGEVVSSYAGRLARRNYSTVDEIETAMRAQGLLAGRGRRSESRRALWRALGDLHPRAFTEPQVVQGNWVVERPLCTACTKEDSVQGLLPQMGYVCLKKLLGMYFG